MGRSRYSHKKSSWHRAEVGWMTSYYFCNHHRHLWKKIVTYFLGHFQYHRWIEKTKMQKKFNCKNRSKQRKWDTHTLCLFECLISTFVLFMRFWAALRHQNTHRYTLLFECSIYTIVFLLHFWHAITKKTFTLPIWMSYLRIRFYFGFMRCDSTHVDTKTHNLFPLISLQI